MRIGIDFDNTIACYDGVFHATALERGLIGPDLARDKTSVREYLNGSGRNDAFTELQGHVYGARMDLVVPYAGACEFIAAAVQAGHDVFIVSHKTAHPLRGPKHDLHAAARGFLATRAIAGVGGTIPEDRVHFELTKDTKQARATTLGVDVFIDDLPEILAMAGWPDGMRRLLFDPDARFPNGNWGAECFERFGSWADIHRALLDG